MIHQEIEANHLLPAIRREIAKLLFAQGVKKSRIALLLRITKAAVSQYISGKRGSDFVLEPSVVKSCSSMILGGKESTIEIQKLISSLKDSKKVCGIYKKNNIVPDDCEFCRKGC
jgi:predicted transcriptional regulator